MTETDMALWHIDENNAEEIADGIAVSIASRMGLSLDIEGDVITFDNGTESINISLFSRSLSQCESIYEIQKKVASTLCNIPEMSQLLDISKLRHYLSQNVLQGRRHVGYCALIFGIILSSRVQQLSLGKDGLHLEFAPGLPFSITELLTATSRILPGVDKVIETLPHFGSAPVHTMPTAPSQ